MNTTFALNQSNDGKLQLAHLKVPGCGRAEKDDAPVVSIEIEDGNVTLLVYADINSEEATHEIPLNGALLAKKVAANE
jgi:hypothetical protein